MKWHDSNFYIGTDITSLSSCCVTEDEKVYCVNDENKIEVKQMKDFSKGDVVKLLNRSGVVKGRKVELPNTKMYKISTHNGVEFVSSYNHINLINRNGEQIEVQTQNLQVGDQIAFFEKSFENNFVCEYTNSVFDNTKEHADTFSEKGLIFFKISSITEDSYDKDVHCFEILDSDEKYFTLANGIYTHNCRLVNNLSDLTKKKESLGFINSIGGTSLKIGSLQVNTVNMARIALESKYKQDVKGSFIELLRKRAVLALQVLDVIRSIIKRNVDKGLLPIYQHKILELENQYNTLGVAAMYDALDILGMIETDSFGNKFYTREGEKFAVEILEELNKIKDEFTEDKPYLVNIEAVPAEKAAVTLCRKDKLLYGMTNVTKNIYANQWISLTDKCTMTEKIKLSSILDKLVGGKRLPPYTEMCSKKFA